MSNNALNKGTDSGSVPENTKRQIFVNQLGFCAEPDCNKRIMQDRTLLAECAHIIPRKVGSHPREDHKTSLEDRKKEPNLLYLCKDHHALVDDPNHAEKYTAEVLRGWKEKHEAWAKGVNKNSPYIPAELKSMLDGFEKQYSQQVNFSSQIIQRLIDACRDFLDRNLVSEATAFLSQIDLLLLGGNNTTLNAKADLLTAILSIRTEKISEAKDGLLRIIEMNPEDVEAMLEYVELCDNVPEPLDDARRVETLARTLAKDHPRLNLIDLIRKFRNQESVDLPDTAKVWTNDIRLNAKFLVQYALFADVAQKVTERDMLIGRYEKEVPTSPRPHLFRAHFKVMDYARLISQASVEQSGSAHEILNYITSERDKTLAKDPKSLRDQVSWLMTELRLRFAHFDFSDSGETVSLLRNRLFELVGKCYFDIFINNILVELLDRLRAEIDQWRVIVKRIQESKVAPSKTVVDLLFLQGLQHPDLYSEITCFLTKQNRSDLEEILSTIAKGDVESTAQLLNAKANSMFSLYVLESLSDTDFCLSLSEQLEVEDQYQTDLLYLRLKFIDPDKKGKEVLDLIAKLPLDNAGPLTLRNIEQITYRYRRWHIFIPAAQRLLSLSLPLGYRTQLYGVLAIAYWEQGDDTNAIKYAEEALQQLEHLGDQNSQNQLYILGKAHARKGNYDKACEVFQVYAQVERNSSLFLQEADLYLKSTLINKHDKALSLVLRAFEVANTYDNELYFAALLVLIELDNVGKIPKEDESIVNDGLFIKLSGFDDLWFYIGEQQSSLGAKSIRSGTPSYNAVISRSLGQEIDWPPDKYSSPNAKRTIVHIVSAIAFLSIRAHESMVKLAQIGSAPVWSVQMTESDGSVDLSNLLAFLSEQSQPSKSFFDKYASARIPFALLCSNEGGLVQALGKISSEKKGFIYINDGSQTDINTQITSAKAVLQGDHCFIDGIAALVFSDAELLDDVLRAVPHMGVPTCVIRLLRETAEKLETVSSTVGRLSFIDGNMEFRPNDKERANALRRHLLDCADLFDHLPNKVIGKSYPRLSDDKSIDSVLPDYFTDAFHYSKDTGNYLLTDDSLLIQAYKLMEKTPIPRQISTLSLIRAMAESNLITWDRYLKYFARLSWYRYHLLPVSDEEMLRAIFPSSLSGLVSAVPENIRLLNLPLTLSQEYGVDEQVAIKVVASFFTKLILDDTATPELVDKVFRLTIRQAFVDRNKWKVAKEVYQHCRQSLEKSHWSSQDRSQKLNILNQQLMGFIQGVELF